MVACQLDLPVANVACGCFQLVASVVIEHSILENFFLPSKCSQ